MADLITVLVLMLGAGSAAEWVRTTCRRRLLTPVAGRRPMGRPTDPQPFG